MAGGHCAAVSAGQAGKRDKNVTVGGKNYPFLKKMTFLLATARKAFNLCIAATDWR